MLLEVSLRSRNADMKMPLKCDNLLCNAILEPPVCAAQFSIPDTDITLRLLFCCVCADQFEEGETHDVIVIGRSEDMP